MLFSLAVVALAAVLGYALRETSRLERAEAALRPAPPVYPAVERRGPGRPWA